MAKFEILRMQRLKSFYSIRRSVKHAFRAKETLNADPSKLKENSFFFADDVATAIQNFKKRMPEKIRKNAVYAVEFLVTASPEVMKEKTREAQDSYFADALRYIQDKHGSENVVFAGVHRDETTPHMYAYVVPIDEHGKLNCRHFYGAKNALSELQSDFHAKVGEVHGLDRGIKGSKARHTSIKEYYTRLNAGLVQELDTRINVKPPADGETHEAFARRVISQYRATVNEDYQAMRIQLEEKGRAVEQIQEQHQQAISLIDEYEELLLPIHTLKPGSKAKLKAEMVFSITEARENLLQEEKREAMATMTPVERLELEYREARESPEFEKMGPIEQLAMVREWRARIVKAQNSEENAIPVRNDYYGAGPF